MRLESVGTFSLTIPRPFDFAKTVAKPAGWHWSTPKEQFENGVLWSGIVLSGRPTGLRISSVKNRVEVTLYADGPLSGREIDSLREVVWYGLGAGEDLAGFYEFARGDPILLETIHDLHGMRMGLVDDVFGGVVLAILLQMAPMSRSNRMMDAFLEHFGARIEMDGREVILWPAPDTISRIDPQELRRVANLGYRADRVAKAATYLSDHPISLRVLSDLPEEEALARLMEIPGIGKYSAGIILGQSSLPIDAWSVVIMSELFLGHTPASPRHEIDRVISELISRWGKWSWFAFVYILNDLENLSKSYHLSRLT